MTAAALNLRTPEAVPFLLLHLEHLTAITAAPTQAVEQYNVVFGIHAVDNPPKKLLTFGLPPPPPCNPKTSTGTPDVYPLLSPLPARDG